MKKFEWNKDEMISICEYDTNASAEKFYNTFSTLKSRLSYPPGNRRTDDHIADIGKGIAMIMDYIEDKEQK